MPAGETNMTPLHEAVICKNLKIVSLLVSRGADINAINSRGQYPKYFVLQQIYNNTIIIISLFLQGPY